MEKDSSTLSHSISRLLGYTDDAHLDRMDLASDKCSKEKRLSCRNEPPQTGIDTERCSSSLLRKADQDPCIYPWMQIHHKSRQEKKRKSKPMNFDCVVVKL